MNNAKIWLVVKPTVGVPLFLGAVALGSVMVHTQVLYNTTWLPAFLSGAAKKTAALDVPNATVVGSNAVVVFKSTVAAADGGQEAVVVMPDGRTAKVVFSAPEGTTTTAMANTDAAIVK